jgi:hypothetical protein
MEINGFIAFGGWLLAMFQFVLTHLEGRKKNDEELLEKTLGYFERGTQARSIGISLVSAIWLKKKKYLEVIVPVLVSQLIYLLTDAEDFGQERRNLVRLVFLLDDCMSYSLDPQNESIEVMEAILSAALSPGNIDIGKQTLRLWYAKFNNDDSTSFDAETEHLQ